jgi:hypothetical protein
MLFADTGVEDNGNDDDEEEVKDVAEEVEGYSSSRPGRINMYTGTTHVIHALSSQPLIQIGLTT